MSNIYLSIQQQLDGFRSGDLKPSNMLLAYQSQYKKVNEKVNAFAFTYYPQALQQAELADQHYAKGEAAPVEGICVAIKDETYIAGQPMTNGSLLLKDNIATTTDPVAERLLSQNAMVIGRTTTPEFSTSGVTWSDLWGVSRSPWNTEVSCGGSSGGSAIAVATAMAAFANGTDIGGSIRIPAAMCGVYGYKPPHGRVAEIAPFNIDPYCHHGVLARNVDDILLSYQAIKGPHWCDSHSFIPDMYPSLEATKPLSELKIGISYRLGFFEVEEDIQQALKDTARMLEQAGAKVDEVEPDWDAQVINTAKIHQRSLMGQLLKRQYAEHPQYAELTSYVKTYLAWVDKLTTENIFQANLHACQMWDKLAVLFKHYDLIICPTVATTRVKADFDYTKEKMWVKGKEVDGSKGWFMTYPFNTLGQCPVLAMPNGLADNGIPTSIQLVGRPYEEQHIFTAARFIEQNQPQQFYNEVFPDY